MRRMYMIGVVIQETYINFQGALPLIAISLHLRPIPIKLAM